MLTFLRAQLSSLTGSLADFLITAILVELTGTGIMPASIEGTVSGGIVNFLINRSWVFAEGRNRTPVQIARYALVWVGNLGLNAAGMYLLLHFTSIPYLMSKVMVSVLVGISYNYFLQKRFVFK